MNRGSSLEAILQHHRKTLFVRNTWKHKASFTQARMGKIYNLNLWMHFLSLGKKREVNNWEKQFHRSEQHRCRESNKGNNYPLQTPSTDSVNLQSPNNLILLKFSGYSFMYIHVGEKKSFYIILLKSTLNDSTGSKRAVAARCCKQMHLIISKCDHLYKSTSLIEMLWWDFMRAVIKQINEKLKEMK